MNPTLPNPIKSLVASLCLGVTLVACATPQTRSPITIDGSSTVYPITRSVAEAFQQKAKDPVEVNVSFSGTTGGFRKFCEGKTDISNASRPISKDEIALCNRNDIRFVELPVAFDALTVVVNPKNTWLSSITTEELKKIWEPAAEKKMTRWNQIRPEFPDQPINLFGPGKDSGTFDYFTEAIVGKADASRQDYVKSEDDDILVQGVEQDPYAMGYFGFAYYESQSKGLKPVAIDSGKGAILPSRETVERAQYQPLARPLFIYVNLAKAQDNPALRDFVEFYLANAPAIVAEVGYVPLPEDGYHLAKVTFSKGEAGSVFGGKAVFDLTIQDLLRQQAKF